MQNPITGGRVPAGTAFSHFAETLGRPARICLGAFVLALALCLVLAACSTDSLLTSSGRLQPDDSGITASLSKGSGKSQNEEASASGELEKLRTSIKANGCGAAVAHLGLFGKEAAFLREYLESCEASERYPFIKDIPPERLVRAGGSELYLIVPAASDTAVRVREWILNESNGYLGEAGDTVLYASAAGEPFLLECNYSDIMPNTVVYLDVGGDEPLEYSPSLSLRDGSLNYPGVFKSGYGIMDITVYETSVGLNTSDIDTILAHMRRNDQVCAVAFLGWFGSTWEYLHDYLGEHGYLAMFPYLADVTEDHFACGEGDELFLIVPRNPGASVTINQINGSGKAKTVLYRGDDGNPILVQGNSGSHTGGEVRNNLELNIAYGDRMLTGSLGLDFDTGDLRSDLPILDMMDIPVEELESVKAEKISGMWEGYVLPDDGRESYSVYFELHDDGTVLYLCSTLDGDSADYVAQQHYYGTWKYQRFSQAGMPASAYVFDLELDHSTGDGAVPLQTIHSIQYAYLDAGQLVIQIVDGDNLYANGWEYSVLLDNASYDLE